MAVSIDLTGKSFGRLVVLKRALDDKRIGTFWLCQCSCGNRKNIRGGDLKNGRTRSCGCLLRETTIKRSFKHGHSTRNQKSKMHSAWEHMIQRCGNPNDSDYIHYGGRGIKVCDRWKEFVNFLEDMGEPPTKDHSIDRIKNDKGYCKSNCQWATRKDQGRNKRNNHLIAHEGRTQCLSAWAEELGMGSSLLRYRLKHWSVEKAFTTPVRRRKEG